MYKRPNYLSYLLRVWRSNGEGETAWQASLENPHTGERIGFATLDELFIFLRRQIGMTPGSEGSAEPIRSDDHQSHGVIGRLSDRERR